MRSISNLPDSILEKSRMSLMMVSRASPLTRMVSAVFALLGGEGRVQQQAGHADDAVHRRADFVAHHR